MKRTTLLGLLVIALTISACSQTNSNPQNNQKTSRTMNNPFPFEITDNSGQHTITAALENEDLFNKYYPFFEQHGYEGNGYCWEGHIIQILEKRDQELLDHLEFDPEAGAFYAYADSKETQTRFVNLLSPIFADLEQLEEYVKTAERDRIDD